MAASKASNNKSPAEQGIYTLLGFAQKAGKLYGGGDAVAQAMLRGQVKIVLIAWDISENSLGRFQKRWQQLTLGQQREISVWRFGSKEQLGMACGKPPRGIWGIGDEGFCKGLADKLGQLAGLLDGLEDCGGTGTAKKMF